MSRKVDANSRIVLTGGAIGLGLSLIGAMAWADGSSAATDDARLSDALPAATDTSAPDVTTRRIIVILPGTAIRRAEVPTQAVPSRQQSAQAPVSRAPVSRTQGS